MKLDLASMIRKYRADRALSQEALAQAWGMTQAHVGRLETGDVLPSIPTLQKIARALNLSPEKLGRLVMDLQGRPPGRAPELRAA